MLLCSLCRKLKLVVDVNCVVTGVAVDRVGPR